MTSATPALTRLNASFPPAPSPAQSTGRLHMNAKNYFASFCSRPRARALVPKSPYSLPCSPLHVTLLTLTRAFFLALLSSFLCTISDFVLRHGASCASASVREWSVHFNNLIRTKKNPFARQTLRHPDVPNASNLLYAAAKSLKKSGEFLAYASTHLAVWEGPRRNT